MDSSKTGYELNFPAYFVSESKVYIKLDLDIDTNEIFSQTTSGIPYSVDQVISDAHVITETEYTKALEKESLPK